MGAILSSDTNTQQRIVLASNNAGKLAEFERLLQPLNVTVLPQKQFNIKNAEEPYGTFVENALAKARHASAATGLPAIADDSGICVDALQGAPGVLSARYALEQKNSGNLDDSMLARLRGLDEDGANNALLLQQMQSAENRRACFVAVIVHVRNVDDPLPQIAQGIWWGGVATTAQGEHGFGYDPIFWIPELKCTAAALDPQQKNKYSHR